jgi:hypothetical protein
MWVGPRPDRRMQGRLSSVPFFHTVLGSFSDVICTTYLSLFYSLVAGLACMLNTHPCLPCMAPCVEGDEWPGSWGRCTLPSRLLWPRTLLDRRSGTNPPLMNRLGLEPDWTPGWVGHKEEGHVMSWFRLAMFSPAIFPCNPDVPVGRPLVGLRGPWGGIKNIQWIIQSLLFLPRDLWILGGPLPLGRGD